MVAPLPLDEIARLESLRQYDVMDTLPEEAFDDLTQLAAQLCEAPMAAIALVDENRQWFKARVGLRQTGTSREASFCSYAVLQPELMQVPDTLADSRFAANPLVTGEPHVRFYAGVPLITPDGHAIGALCVYDRVPRKLKEHQEEALRGLGRQAIALLEARPDNAQGTGQTRRERRRVEWQRQAISEEAARTDAERFQGSEARYRRLFESAKDGILILDAATGKIEDANPFLCHLLNYAREDFLGRQLWEIGAFRDIAANREAFRTLQEQEYIRYEDLPLETRDGSSVSAEFVSNVYLCGGKKVIQCNIRDIRERKRAAAAELESKRFLQSTLDALEAHIAVLDETGTIIAVNQAWSDFAREQMGTQISCGVGANYLAVCDAVDSSGAPDGPAVARGIRETMAGRDEVFCLEYPCHSPSQERWFNVCATRFGGEGLVRVVVAHENITARKLAERALAERTGEIVQTWESMTDAFYTLDRQWRFTYVNPQALRLWRRDAASLLGKSVWDEFRPTVDLKFYPEYHRAVEQMEPVSFEEYYAPEAAWREVRAFPSAVGLSVYFRDITERKDAEAAQLRVLDELETRVAQRTTELARVNADLLVQIAVREAAEAESRARTGQQEAVAELGRRALADFGMDDLLQGATELVCATLNVDVGTILELTSAGEGLRVRANHGWRDDVSQVLVPIDDSSQAGYSLHSNSPTIVADLRTETRFVPSQFMLKHGVVSAVTVIIGGYQHPFGTLGALAFQPRAFGQDDVHFLQTVANVLAAALERNRIESSIRLLNDQLKTINDQLRIENQAREMALTTLSDVSIGLKQAKEEAETAREFADSANHAKSEFLSRMSHELRTPLNAILGFGQILEDDETDPLRRESVQFILKGGRHLLDLINEVLDIARVEAGNLELSLEPVALDDIISETCDMVRPLAAARRIRLERNLASECRGYIQADRQRLKQVLLNLLANAIKYNREGGLVEVTCRETPDGQTQIAVRDTGLGISPRDLPKLFTPFERLGAANLDTEGTGLGLVLARRLTSAMGGTLSVQSTMGRGSVFTVELATADSPELGLNLPETPPEQTLTAPPERMFGVLCIEDNPSNLRLLEVILSRRPEINLLAAMQGSIGLDLAIQHHPDLILLDLNLPDMNGKEVLARLRQSDATRDIPVVIVSADATPGQIERLLAAGANAYITKPLDVTQVLGTVDRFLHGDPPAEATLLAVANHSTGII